MSQPIAIGVSATEDALVASAQQLAQQLQLPFCDTPLAAHRPVDWLLQVSPAGLCLQDVRAAVSLHVDFVSGALAHRRRFGGGRGQTIAKAIGIKAGRYPSVLDATAGLGRDAFVCASLGCCVQLLERSPIVAALLADGLRRASMDADIGAWVAQRLHLQPADACAWLQDLPPSACPEVIYLDPMYPERKKSALVKKDMQLLQKLLGADSDSEALLHLALQRARRRVVVKRPKAAPPLAAHAPSLSISSKNTRFDIYLA